MLDTKIATFGRYEPLGALVMLRPLSISLSPRG